MITVEPDEDLVRHFGEQGGAGKSVYGQLAVCYDRDEKAASVGTPPPEKTEPAGGQSAGQNAMDL